MTGVEIVAYSNKHRSVYLNLTVKFMIFTIFLLIVSIISAFMSGRYSANSYYSNELIDNQLVSIEKQQKEINQVKKQSEISLKLLASRIGTLESQSIRINAVADHLLDFAKLDDIELPNTTLSTEFNLRVSDHELDKTIDFMETLEQLDSQLKEQNARISALDTIIKQRAFSEKIIPSIMPVKAYVSSWFGPRNDPINKNGKKIFHEGIDFSADKGSNIISTAAGIVTWAGPLDNYGNVVEINHGRGFVTRYAHNHENFVNVGDRVNKGQLIGSVGNSGRSTGPHLHYEVIKNGKYLDPKNFMKLN